MFSLVTAAQAYGTLVPLSSTFSAIYASCDSANPPRSWTYTLTASGPAHPFNGIDFYYMTEYSYGSPGGITNNFYAGSSDTAVYGSDLSIMFPIFELGNVGHSWQVTFPGDTAPTTSTILSTTYPYTILSSGVTNYDAYLVKATYVGKDTGSSTFMYEVWLPGVGEIASLDYGAIFPPQYNVLNGYSVNMVPAPNGLLLLSSGLACLVGWRKLSMR